MGCLAEAIELLAACQVKVQILEQCTADEVK